MKNLSTFLIACFIGLSSLTAQTVIFSDDFETQGFPTGYTLYDQDGNTVNSNVASFFPNAWNRIRFTGDPNNFIASTSWYTPADTADDWVVTSAINLTTSNYVFFKTRSGNANAPDGFEVRISTTNNSVSSFNTTLLSVPSESTTWTSHGIDLSAYNNQTVYLAWRNITYDGYVLGLDEIEVVEVLNGDARIGEITVASKVEENSTVNITGAIEHLGADTLNSVDVNWRINGGAVNTETVSGLSLKYGETQNFSHNVTYTPSNAGSFSNLEVWTSNPNGQADPNPANDTLNKNVLVMLGNGVQRNVLFEEFTTAVCQFCPDGHRIMANIIAQNPNVIPVSVHSCFNTDSMTNQEALDLCATLGSGAAPTAMVDRFQHEGDDEPAHSRANNQWVNRTDARSQIPSTASIAIEGTYDDLSRAVSLDVDVSFIDYEVSGDIRLSLMIIEDSLSGTGSGWAQYNAYYGVQGHPMYGVGTPFPAPNDHISYINNYQHRHVLRDILPSTWGDANVISSNPSVDSIYNKSFNFNLNNNFNDNRVSFVAVVSYKGNTTDGYEVINAEEIILSDVMKNDGKDLALTRLTLPRVVTDGDSVQVIGEVKNVGQDTINSFDLNWSVDNGTTYTESYSNLNLVFGDTLMVNHTDKAELVGINTSKDVSVWISNINGSVDDYAQNNSKQRSILVEEPIDGELSSLNVETIVGDGDNVSISGFLTNKGADTINTVDVSWSVDNNTVQTETFTGLDLAFGESSGFTHGTTWQASGVNTSKGLKVWISNTNGIGETNHANDTVSQSIEVMPQVDLELGSIDVDDTLVQGQEVEIKGEVTNLGLQTVQSFVVGWAVDNGTVYLDTISSLSLNNNDNYMFTHKDKYTPPSTLSGGIIDVFIKNVNGSSQQITSNDSLSKQFVAIVGLYENPSFLTDIQIYPNPVADDLINLELNLTENKTVELSLFDITGKLLLNEDYGTLSVGNHVKRIKFLDFNNGVYFMTLKMGDNIVTRKIIVSK